MSHFHPRLASSPRLVEPVAVDRDGVLGPTPGQARGTTWRRSSPALYVPSSVSRTVEQRILEQARRLPVGGAVGGWASLRMLGAAYAEGVAPTGEELPVPLVLPPGRDLRALPGGQVVRPVALPPVVTRHGVPCVDAAYAVAWEARLAPDLRAAVTWLDMCLAAGVATLDDVRRVACGLSRLPGLEQLRTAIRHADPRSRSPRETWLRLVWVLDARLPTPRVNWQLRDLAGRSVGWPDLVHPELPMLGEYDGAAHRGAARHRRDERRKQDFRDLGLEVVTVVGGGPGEEAAVARQLLAAVARAERLTGPRLWTAHEARLWD